MDAHRQDQLDVTAYHEAAHAVAYWWIGRPFRYVTIRSRFHIGNVVPYYRQIDKIDRAVIAAAGPIAEYHYVKDLSDRFPKAGNLGSDDNVLASISEAVEIRELGDDMPDDAADFGTLISQNSWLVLWHYAKDHITGDLWPAVDAVAQALLASPRRLSYREVSAIAEQALQESEMAA